MPRTPANASGVGVAVATGEAFVSVLVVAGWLLHPHVTSAQPIIIKKDPRKLILYPSAICFWNAGSIPRASQRDGSVRLALQKRLTRSRIGAPLLKHLDFILRPHLSRSLQP